MKNVIDEFGENAGKVWQALNTQGPLPHTRLIRTAKLKNDDLYTAIGWLARENKINMNSSTNNGAMYAIGETNLTGKIGSDAGKVWHALNKLGESDAQSIARYARLDNGAVFSALGWLARENKVHAHVDRDQQIKFSLK